MIERCLEDLEHLNVVGFPNFTLTDFFEDRPTSAHRLAYSRSCSRSSIYLSLLFPLSRDSMTLGEGLRGRRPRGLRIEDFVEKAVLPRDVFGGRRNKHHVVEIRVEFAVFLRGFERTQDYNQALRQLLGERAKGGVARARNEQDPRVFSERGRRQSGSAPLRHPRR